MSFKSGIDAAFGAYHAMNFKRPRIEDTTLNGTSFSQQVNASKKMASGTEYGDSRRAKQYTVRLHPAKYLKCDALMKELFFPILTMAHRFGFCSTSGMGQTTAGKLANGNLAPDDVVAFSKAAGCYRGIAAFTIRSQAIGNASANKLNTVNQTVGFTQMTGTGSVSVNSAYRRFNNGPVFLDANGSPDTNKGGGVVTPDSSKPPTVVHSVPTDNADNQLRVLEVGSINELETKAVQSGPFHPALNVDDSGDIEASVGTTAVGTYEGTIGGVGGSNWNGVGSVVSNTNTYYANLKNTTIRIADGYLEMDITNGKSVSAFIEVVIHAHRKHDSDISTQQLINTIVNSVQYQQTDRNVDAYYNGDDSQTRPGGWQALWDPTYPLLGCKSQHRKPIDDIAKEVHRSNHMLGPGQSKLVKIFLGNLYYDLGNKCSNNTYDYKGQDPPDTAFVKNLSFDNPATGIGALQVFVGHSGVEQLSAPADPAGGSTEFSVLPDSISGDFHDIPGIGFWVGKSFCPSEIAVSGTYCEKFYPAYMVDKERRNFSDTYLRPPSMGSSTMATLPTALPVQDVIATVNGSTGAPSNVSSAVRDI